MKNPTCQNCQHFHQHYVFVENKLLRARCGHCTLQHIRRKFPDAKICDHFIPGTDDTEPFASKEYVTKALLQHLLKLELLPEIAEAPENKPRKKSK